MSNTATAPASTTVSAEIEVTHTGDAYLRVAIDGDVVAFRINPHFLRLRNQTVTGEAERLLQRHAGYAPASHWTTDTDGRLTTTVAEMTGRCTACVHGCGCSLGSTGCGHYGCPAATPEIAHTCDGAALALSAKRPPLPGRPAWNKGRKTH
jgi:hypothetical protein